MSSLFVRRIRQRWHAFKGAYYRFVHHSIAAIDSLSTVLSVVVWIISLACLVGLTVYVGYDHSQAEARLLRRLLHVAQGVFAFNILFNIMLNLRNTMRNTRPLKWIGDIAILLTVVVWIIPASTFHGVMPWLVRMVYSNRFLFVVLGLYSIIDFSFGVMKVIGRRTNPSIILSCSFLFFIIIGSLMLMLPKCTYAGISYTDSLFVSTSAVCITGLTPVDIPSTFTPLGMLILSVLVQIGGLGVITFTSFFAIFFSGSTSIYNQLLIKDMIYSKSMNSLIPTLLYILTFTLAVEFIGAVAVYFTIPAELGLTFNEQLKFAGFHSIMSFCNAGFSNIPDGMANAALMNSNQSIYIVTTVLIVAGAIGFPILVNFKDIIVGWLRRLTLRVRHIRLSERPVHLYDLNTKLVLVTYLGIFAVSWIAFLVMEYDNTLSGMSIYEKTVQSALNAVIPRSAGFTTVQPSRFMPATLLMVVVLMSIGGASQSMAGGVKVNSVAAVCLNIRSIIFGHKGISAYKRNIAVSSVRRANTVIILALIALTLYGMTILLLEPGLSTKELLFEVVSALFTVGSSLGVTPHLSVASKIVLCTAMFVGRVGIVSLLSGFAGQSKDHSLHFPSENIIIN